MLILPIKNHLDLATLSVFQDFCLIQTEIQLYLDPSDYQTINSRNNFSFKVNGQIYHKINLAGHPLKTSEGEIEPLSYNQMYFLDPNEAIKERLTHPLNSGTSRNLMNLLEITLKYTNDYVKGYKNMREVEDDANQLAALLGQEPPNVQLLLVIENALFLLLMLNTVFHQMKWL